MNGRIEFVRTDAEQPYHVRVIAGNGEPVLSSENLEHEADAERVALLLAQMFGAFSPEILRVTLPDGDEGHLFGCRQAVPVRYVDERGQAAPVEPVVVTKDPGAAEAIAAAKAAGRPAARKPRKTAAKRATKGGAK